MSVIYEGPAFVAVRYDAGAVGEELSIYTSSEQERLVLSMEEWRDLCRAVSSLGPDLKEGQRVTAARAEEIHAEHHSGYIVPSLDSCPEHTRAEYEAIAAGLTGGAS